MSADPADDARKVESLEELVSLLELTDIVAYEHHAVRLDDAHGEPVEALDVQFRQAESTVEVRGRMSVEVPGAKLVADSAAVFTATDAPAVPETLAREFTERVGIMALYPYLRESVYSSAARLGVARPVLGLLRAGQFAIDRAPGDA